MLLYRLAQAQGERSICAGGSVSMEQCDKLIVCAMSILFDENNDMKNNSFTDGKEM